MLLFKCSKNQNTNEMNAEWKTGFKVISSTKTGKPSWFLFHFLFQAFSLSFKLQQNFMNPLQLAPQTTTRIFTYWVRQQRSNASESHSEDTVVQIPA